MNASNRVDIWRPQGFARIEVHRGFHVTLGYPRHWHDEVYFCATLEGTSYLECRGTSFAAPPGTLVAVPPGEVHANQKTGCSFRCIFLGQQELRDAAEQYVERSISVLDFRGGLLEETQATASFLRLHRSLEDPSSPLRQDASLSAFAYRFASLHGATTAPRSRDGNDSVAVRCAQRFLEEHYAQPVWLRDLAKLTGVSPFRLNRSFCRTIGMPPHAYQLQVRIGRAKWHLQQGRSAAETAALVGFFDQSHFAHSFKRSEGITPRQYLRFCKNLQDGRTHSEYFEAES